MPREGEKSVLCGFAEKLFEGFISRQFSFRNPDRNRFSNLSLRAS
jgi:hypothetical protein